jgi:hypothetical protein
MRSVDFVVSKCLSSFLPHLLFGSLGLSLQLTNILFKGDYKLNKEFFKRLGIKPFSIEGTAGRNF